MSVSDAEFRAWLLADDKRRCVLAEVQAWSGGAVVTRYLSNLGYVSRPTDLPPNQPYDEILAEVPSITSRMSDGLAGYSAVSFGDLHIHNGGGALDAWLLDAWDGRPVRLLLGDPAWAKADFRQIFFGAIADIEVSGSARLTLKLRDRQHLLDVPALPSLVGGAGPAKDRRLPAAFGLCRHVDPVLIDEATRTYAVHDGPIQAVDQVYSNGVPVAFSATLASGTFSLSAPASGQITADVRGCKSGGVYVDTTADIVRRIVDQRTDLGDFDAASFAALNAAVPGVVGLYISGDGVKVLGALDALMVGVGGYYAVDRAGRLVVGQLAAASGAPVLTLTDEDLRYGQARMARRLLPKRSVRVGYARIFARISAPDSSLSAGLRQRLADEYQVAKAANTVPQHLMAVDADIAPSCFALEADAAAEAARRAALWGQLRRVFQLPGFMAAQQLRLGDVIELQLSRYGLGGELGVVVGLRESITGGRVEVEVLV